MKDNSKDPYNFEKTEEFIREYNMKTNGKKQQSGGKIYMKRQNNNKNTQNEGRE